MYSCFGCTDRVVGEEYVKKEENAGCAGWSETVEKYSAGASVVVWQAVNRLDDIPQIS